MYNVIAAEYDRYGLVYSCTDLPDGNSVQFAFILTRSRLINQYSLRNYYNIYRRNGIDTRYFKDFRPARECFFFNPNADQKRANISSIRRSIYY